MLRRGVRHGAVVTAFALAVTTVGLLVPSTAAAAPWDGGYGYVSPLEQRIAEIATLLSDRQASAYCNSPEQWQALGEDSNVLGFVPVNYYTTASFMMLGPFTCSYDDAFLAHPQRDGQKECQTGSETQYQTETYTTRVRRRVRINGRWVWRTVVVQKTRTVPVQVPVYGPCPDYLNTIIALETISHESMHILGIHDEPAAECFGMQLLTLVAYKMGADAEFAFEIGEDYVPYYAQKQTSLPEYWSPDCYDGGSLDIWKDKQGWPFPTSQDVASAAFRNVVPEPATPSVTGPTTRLYSFSGEAGSR